MSTDGEPPLGSMDGEVSQLQSAHHAVGRHSPGADFIPLRFVTQDPAETRDKKLKSEQDVKRKKLHATQNGRLHSEEEGWELRPQCP